MIPISAVSAPNPLHMILSRMEPSRELVVAIEKGIADMPGATISFPVTDQLSGGMYVRAYHLPHHGIAAGRCHKYDHWAMVLGDIDSLTDEGLERLKGPIIFPVKAGAKRIIFGREASTYITFHRTDAETTEGIVDELSFVSYEEYDDWKAAQERILLPLREEVYA